MTVSGAPPLPSLGTDPTGADATRERLLVATHELFYSRRSTVASVAEICGRAEANVAMVKYCFGSKDALLDALIERITASFQDELERLDGLGLGPEETLRRHVAGIVGNYVRYPYVNRLLNERLMAADADAAARLSEVFARPTREWHRRLLARGVEQGAFRDGVDPTFFFFSIMGLCEFMFLATPWLQHAFGEALDDTLVERFVQHTADLVLTGLAPA